MSNINVVWKSPALTPAEQHAYDARRVSVAQREWRYELRHAAAVVAFAALGGTVLTSGTFWLAEKIAEPAKPAKFTTPLRSGVGGAATYQQ